MNYELLQAHRYLTAPFKIGPCQSIGSGHYRFNGFPGGIRNAQFFVQATEANCISQPAVLQINFVLLPRFQFCHFALPLKTGFHSFRNND